MDKLQELINIANKEYDGYSQKVVDTTRFRFMV